MSEPEPSRPRAFKSVLLLGLPLLAIGGAVGWFGHAAASLSNRAAMETVVHDYILAHPEILPEAMERLRHGQNRARLSGIRTQVEAPFPGAVLGNPAGKVTLVEFTDFACGYCRQSIADVDALIAANPDLRVVMRELPILSPQSALAARWALAAAEQGRYPAFHKAMFEGGRPSPETIAAAAKTAGLDIDRAKRAIAAPGIDAELSRNLGFARTLGFEGTPSWIAGQEILSGAVGRDRLAKALGSTSG